MTHLVAVDQGYDNPLYAALEVDYRDSDEDPTGEAYQRTQKVRFLHAQTVWIRIQEVTKRLSETDQQNLTFYELDLGLNHVVRKWSEPTDRRANMLVQGEFDRVRQFCFGNRDHELTVQCPAVKMPTRTALTALQEYWFAAKTTSFGNIWMPRRTEYLFRGDGIRLRSGEKRVEGISLWRRLCTRSR